MPNWHLNSNVEITVRRNGFIVARYGLHNLIVTTGLGLARDAILGFASFEITETAIGSGNTAPNVGDTELDAEELRVAIIRREVIDSDTALTTAYIAPDEANSFTIQEIGWFGGAANDVLISRVLFSHAKTELESVQIDRQDSFAEAP